MDYNIISIQTGASRLLKQSKNLNLYMCVGIVFEGAANPLNTECVQSNTVETRAKTNIKCFICE